MLKLYRCFTTLKSSNIYMYVFRKGLCPGWCWHPLNCSYLKFPSIFIWPTYLFSWNVISPYNNEPRVEPEKIRGISGWKIRLINTGLCTWLELMKTIIHCFLRFTLYICTVYTHTPTQPTCWANNIKKPNKHISCYSYTHRVSQKTIQKVSPTLFEICLKFWKNLWLQKILIQGNKGTQINVF